MHTREIRTHLLPNVLISEEEPGAEVFCRHVLAVPHDQLADTGEHDVLDRLRRDPAEIDHENRSVSHPVICTHYASSSSLILLFPPLSEPEGGQVGGWIGNRPLLGFEAPQPDLAIIQGRFV